MDETLGLEVIKPIHQYLDLKSHNLAKSAKKEGKKLQKFADRLF